MISLRRPSSDTIAAYRDERLDAPPTCTVADRPPTGFRHEKFSRDIGAEPGSFERARSGLRQWVAHRGSGVEVFPAHIEVSAGETLAIVTRQLGLWVLASCRIATVIDEAAEFGFIYLTLPDHPECGYESFIARQESGRVRFDIEAVSKPGTALMRLGAPVTRVLQQRATNAYLDALEHWTRHAA